MFYLHVFYCLRVKCGIVLSVLLQSTPNQVCHSLSLTNNNVVHLHSGVGGKFWYVSSSGLVCSDGDKPEDFFLEFLEHGRVGIKGKNGKYLRGDSGTLKGDAATVDPSCLWEY